MMTKYTALYFIIILCLYFKYYNKKFKEINIKKNFELSDDKKIPKIIHCTYYDKNAIPSKVWDNLKKYASDYKIFFYNNRDCYSFIKKNFNEQYAEKFENIKLGCHKADFFRYCVMYCKGGIYLDIKIQPKMNFENIFDHESDNLFYTCLGKQGKEEYTIQKIIRRIREGKNGHIFQAVLASYPGNLFFEKLIKDFFIVQNPHKKYHVFTYKFYDYLYDNLGYHLYAGEHNYNNQKIILFKEINEKMGKEDIMDKRDGYHYIFNSNNQIIFRSRYIDFPWDDKPATDYTLTKIILNNKFTKNK